MRKGFYLRIAAQNIRKNAKVYVPYILTCLGTAAMYYMISFLALHEGVDAIFGGAYVRSIMTMGQWVTGLFAVLFLFYTNSFLMKRRKKEFGLYNILGMEKKHLSRVVLYETLFIAAFSLVVGILSGVLLSKLMILVLLKIFDMHTSIDFKISVEAMKSCAVLFGVIFGVLFLNSLRQIHLAKPIELLRGGEVGEKEPRTNWLLAILGMLCLGCGYYISLTIEDPLMTMMLFFIAVILVILGTYMLFTAGSIAILKLLRRWKRFYYKANHFISVSGMIYRMKQNAAGLASICILSTMVLVMISSTYCLYGGLEEEVANRYPADLNFALRTWDTEKKAEFEDRLEAALAEEGFSKISQVQYDQLSISMRLEENGRVDLDPLFGDVMYMDCHDMDILTLSEHNRINQRQEILAEDEVLLWGIGIDYPYETMTLGEKTYQVRQLKEEPEWVQIRGETVSAAWGTLSVVMPDAGLEAFINAYAGMELYERANYYVDLPDSTAEEQMAFHQKSWETEGYWQKQLGAEVYSAGFYVEYQEAARQDLKEMYGGLFFLGIFLGLLFTMATILIIYYKQVSEGYEDRQRFEIMQKVGLSRKMIKQSIRSQVLMVFFLPLLMAGCHLAGAFPAVARIMTMFQAASGMTFLLCNIACFAVFAILYMIIYWITAKVYYRIVS